METKSNFYRRLWAVIAFFALLPFALRLRVVFLNQSQNLPHFGGQPPIAISAGVANPFVEHSRITPSKDFLTQIQNAGTETCRGVVECDQTSEMTVQTSERKSQEIKLVVPATTSRFYSIKKINFFDSINSGVALNYETNFYPIKNMVSEFDKSALDNSFEVLKQKLSLPISHDQYTSILNLARDYVNKLNGSSEIKGTLKKYKLTKLEITDIGEIGTSQNPGSSGFSAVAQNGLVLRLKRERFAEIFKKVLDVQKEQQRMDAIQLLMRTVQSYQSGCQAFPELKDQINFALEEINKIRIEIRSFKTIRQEISLSPVGVVFTKKTPLGPKGVFVYDFMTNTFLLGGGSNKLYPCSKLNNRVGFASGLYLGAKFQYNSLEHTFSHTGYGLHGFVGLGFSL